LVIGINDEFPAPPLQKEEKQLGPAVLTGFLGEPVFFFWMRNEFKGDIKAYINIVLRLPILMWMAAGITRCLLDTFLQCCQVY